MLERLASGNYSYTPIQLYESVNDIISQCYLHSPFFLKDSVDETKQQQAFSDVEESDSEECLGAVACESPPNQEVEPPILANGKSRNSVSSSTDNSTEGFDPSPKQSSDYYYFYQGIQLLHL